MAEQKRRRRRKWREGREGGVLARCALSDESIRFSCFALFHKRKRAPATLFNWNA
jgi:hypothetical protein